MKTWELDLRINSDGCPHRSAYDFCVLWGQDCTPENCAARVEDKPITGEWLEQVGARKAQLAFSVAYHILTLDNILIATEFINGVASVVTDRKFGHTPERWPYIKNRDEFAKLYKALSGKELKQ